jgi:hypothetical protein
MSLLCERMKTWRRVAAVLGVTLGASGVWLAVFFYRVFSSAPSFFQWGHSEDYAFLATLTLLGFGVVLVSYCFGFRERGL